MSSEHVERRLAAILAADVAGSCRLIGIDEEGTLAQLKALRKTLFDPKIAEHHGRIVKNTGDGALVEFASVVDAVRCADEIQRGVAEQNIDVPQIKRIEFRIGIHVGDIIIEENDIFGDGVNIAVRLEGIAEPGGVSISDDAHRQIRGKIGIDYDDMGPQVLKNIVEPMRVWRVRIGPSFSPAMLTKPPIETALPLALPDKPSIAVLPFTNMSGDPEQDYFADGMVEDIITALSRFKALFVIARNSSLTYKGRAVDVKQVGRDLGVRYVLEGSVRKASGRLRITGQLIEAVTGVHLWADHFDGPLEGVFDLQDKIMEKVVGAIAPRVQLAEIERSRRKPVESLDAYDCFLRGIAGVNSFNRIATDDALKLFYRAIEIDPSFPAPYGLAARAYMHRKVQGWTDDADLEEAETRRLALRVAEIGQDDALSLSWAGFALAYVCREYEMGAAFTEQALSLNQNLAAVVVNRGNISSFIGEQEKAIEQFTHGLRLSPLDPEIFRVEGALAIALLLLGRYQEAIDWNTSSLARQPNWTRSVRTSAAAHALAGNLDEARKAMGPLRELNPTLRISRLPQMLPYQLPKDLGTWIQGLRLAGLPE